MFVEIMEAAKGLVRLPKAGGLSG